MNENDGILPRKLINRFFSRESSDKKDDLTPNQTTPNSVESINIAPHDDTSLPEKLPEPVPSRLTLLYKEGKMIRTETGWTNIRELVDNILNEYEPNERVLISVIDKVLKEPQMEFDRLGKAVLDIYQENGFVNRKTLQGKYKYKSHLDLPINQSIINILADAYEIIDSLNLKSQPNLLSDLQETFKYAKRERNKQQMPAQPTSSSTSQTRPKSVA